MKVKRLKGGSRHIEHDDAMEKELAEWIETQRAKSLRISCVFEDSDSLSD